METVTAVTCSEQQTERFGRELGENLVPGDVVAIFGGMGAGKTALTRGIARGLGVNNDVASPTYAIMHEYPGRITLYHFDMYRVSGYEDLLSTGFFEALDSGGAVVVEWSENIERFLPSGHIRVEIEPTGENLRRIRVAMPGGRSFSRRGAADEDTGD